MTIASCVLILVMATIWSIGCSLWRALVITKRAKMAWIAIQILGGGLLGVAVGVLV